MHMRDRVQQEDQKPKAMRTRPPIGPVPLKRRKQKMPHGSDLLQAFTASRQGTEHRRLKRDDKVPADCWPTLRRRKAIGARAEATRRRIIGSRHQAIHGWAGRGLYHAT